MKGCTGAEKQFLQRSIKTLLKIFQLNFMNSAKVRITGFPIFRFYGGKGSALRYAVAVLE